MSMTSTKPTALLVSTDASLIEAVRGVIGSIGNLDLVVTTGIDEAQHAMDWDGLVLLLVHQECVGEADEVTRLLRVIAESKRLLPTLVLSNRHRAEQALALLRSGAVD